MTSHSSVTLLIFSLAFLSLALVSRADEAARNKMCSLAKHPDACLDCINNECPDIKTADMKQLLETVVNCTDTKMAILTYNVHKLRDIAAPAYRASLDDCLSKIDGSHYLFAAINKKIDENNYGDAMAIAKQRIAPGIDRCRDMFVQRSEFATLITFAQNADIQCQNIIQILETMSVKL